MWDSPVVGSQTVVNASEETVRNGKEGWGVKGRKKEIEEEKDGDRYLTMNQPCGPSMTKEKSR